MPVPGVDAAMQLIQQPAFARGFISRPIIHDPFDGFAVINKGGEFELKQVSILGTQ